MAEAFNEAIREFLESNPINLKKIDVVIYQEQEMLKVFRFKIKTSQHSTPFSFRKGRLTARILEAKSIISGEEHKTRQEVELLITSTLEANCEKVAHFRFCVGCQWQYFRVVLHQKPISG